MFSRRWLWTLVLVLAVVGCRNLVQPGEPPRTVAAVRGVIFGPDGLPLSAFINVENRRYAAFGGISDWSGNSDAFGQFEAEVLGFGPFDVIVSPRSDTRFPDFRFLRVMFDTEEPLVLRMPFEYYTGQMAWAGEQPPIELTDLRIGFVYEEIGWFHRIDLIPTPSGRLEGWLTPDREYILDADYFSGDASLDYRWPETLALASGDELDLQLPAIGYDLQPMTGGGAQVAARMRVRTVGTLRDLSRNQITLLLQSGVAPVRAFGFGEISIVQVEPRSEAPFLAKDFFVDLTLPGATVIANLGEYRLDIRVRDSGGLPRSGAFVRVSGGGNAQSFGTGTDGEILMFLDRGSYLLEAGPSSGNPTVTQVVEVLADRDITLTVD